MSITQEESERAIYIKGEVDVIEPPNNLSVGSTGTFGFQYRGTNSTKRLYGRIGKGMP